MIYITSVYRDEWNKRNEVLKRCRNKRAIETGYLGTEVSSVEEKFHKVVTWYNDAFWDPLSLKLIRDLGNSERKGDYGIKTDKRYGIIYGLPYICKLGLLILRSTDLGCNVRLEVQTNAAELWDWLSEYAPDVYLIILKRNLSDFVSVRQAIEIDGIMYKEEKTELNYLAERAREEETPCRMTKEFEAMYFEWFWGSRDISIPMFREMSVQEFLALFPELREWRMNLKGYTVCSNCLKIDRYPIASNTEARICIYLWEKIKNQWSMKKILLKETEGSFADIFSRVIRETAELEDNSCTEYFALVLQDRKECSFLDYEKQALLGIGVQTAEKKITLYEKIDSVCRFHALAGGFL